jgi:hypothetical protein
MHWLHIFYFPSSHDFALSAFSKKASLLW